MFGIEASLWLRIALLVAGVLIVMVSFNTIIRKLLKVEKPKTFSHNHVNEKHKKIDWSIRGFFILLMLIGYSVNMNRLPEEPLFFLETWFLLFCLIITSEIVRAVMEKKYAKNPRAYIVTVSQLGLLVILLGSIFMTDFYGLV